MALDVHNPQEADVTGFRPLMAKFLGLNGLPARTLHNRDKHPTPAPSDNPDQLKSACSGEADSHLARLARGRT
jgi:hypothetical protein